MKGIMTTRNRGGRPRITNNHSYEELVNALLKASGNLTRAAASLGMSRTTFFRRLGEAEQKKNPRRKMLDTRWIEKTRQG